MTLENTSDGQRYKLIALHASGWRPRPKLPIDPVWARSLARDESGFGLIELLIAMVILQVALLALVGAFGAGSFALGRASMQHRPVIADQQMELYRSMTYDAIGLDTAAAPDHRDLHRDTSVCPAGQKPVCGNTGPVNNPARAPGAVLPRAARRACRVLLGERHQSVHCPSPVNNASTPASPDARTYYVDTYIKYGTLIAAQRPAKQVSVVVREETTSKELAVIISTFDCATGNPTNASPC